MKTRAIRGPAERQKNGAFKKIEEMLEVQQGLSFWPPWTGVPIVPLAAVISGRR